MNIIIEKGTYNDIDELESLYNDINDNLAQNINYPGWKKGVYPIREDAISGLDSDTLYIAKSNDTIVGSVILNHEPENGYSNAKWLIEADYNNIFVVHTFVVHPDYMRYGIGKKLMDFSFELAHKQNMKSIRLDVYEKNLPAIKLYEKCGFQYIDTVDLGLSEYGLDWFKLYELVI